jgi:hypothetical protein
LIGELKDLPIALRVPVLNATLEFEHLRVMMDSQRGSILASLCGIEGIVTNSIQNNNNKIFKGKIN